MNIKKYFSILFTLLKVELRNIRYANTFRSAKKNFFFLRPLVFYFIIGFNFAVFSLIGNGPDLEKFTFSFLLIHFIILSYLIFFEIKNLILLPKDSIMLCKMPINSSSLFLIKTSVLFVYTAIISLISGSFFIVFLFFFKGFSPLHIPIVILSLLANDLFAIMFSTFIILIFISTMRVQKALDMLYVIFGIVYVAMIGLVIFADLKTPLFGYLKLFPSYVLSQLITRSVHGDIGYTVVFTFMLISGSFLFIYLLTGIFSAKYYKFIIVSVSHSTPNIKNIGYSLKPMRQLILLSLLRNREYRSRVIPLVLMFIASFVFFELKLFPINRDVISASFETFFAVFIICSIAMSSLFHLFILSSYDQKAGLIFYFRAFPQKMGTMVMEYIKEIITIIYLPFFLPVFLYLSIRSGPLLSLFAVFSCIVCLTGQIIFVNLIEPRLPFSLKLNPQIGAGSFLLLLISSPFYFLCSFMILLIILRSYLLFFVFTTLILIFIVFMIYLTFNKVWRHD